MMSSRLTVRRALTLLVASTLLPMLVGGVVVTVVQWRSEREAAEARLVATAQTVVMAIDRELAGGLSRLRAAAASELIAQGDWVGFHRYAGRVLADWPGALMAVTAADGQLMVNTAVPVGVPLPNLWALEAEHRETDWEGRRLPVSSQGMTRRVFDTGLPQFSDLYYGVSIRRPTLAAAVPVPAPGGGPPRHALTLSFPPASLQALLARLADQPPLRAALVDRSGTVVATNGRTTSRIGERLTPPLQVRSIDRLPVDSDAERDAVAGVGLYESVGRDGIELLGAYAVSATSGYTVRVSMPRSSAYAASRQAAVFWGGLALAVMVLGAVTSTLLAARLRRGLRALARAAEAPVSPATATPPVTATRSVDEIDAAVEALVTARRAEAEAHAATVAHRLAEEQRAAAAVAEDRLRRVVDSLFAFVGLLDLDGRLIEANQAPLVAGGLTRDDVIGRPFWCCAWWTHDAAVGDTLQAAVRRAVAGETLRYDVPVRMAGGRLITIDFQLAPMRDPQGRITHLVASGVDIDARVRATADLRASEERFRALADNITQLAWIADANGTVRWFNRRWYEYTGQDEAAAAHGWTAAHHPDHMDRVRERFARSLAAGDVWEDTFPLRRHDGTYRWFLSRAVPLQGVAGAAPRWFGTNTDITDQLETEQALRRSEERLLAREAALRDADRRKDEFLATLAHELRNPLAPICTSAELIRMRRPDDPVVAQAAAVIQRQSGHLARLVDDLLDVSRITLGTVTLRTRPTDLREVVAGALETTRDAVRRGGHALALTLPDAPLRVDGDPTRLTQVVANLLQNAAKFTPPGGHLALTLAADSGQAVLVVVDDGRGISPSMLGRVFELFVQERPSGDAGSSGLGIGLALARRLVEMHGGTIRASSDGPGRGSRFEVRLPLLRATDGEPAGPAPARAVVGGDPPAVGRPGVPVLVVDDNADAAESLAEVLRLHGHPVTVAHSGAEALDSVARDRPRAVVLDIGLPDMSGHEVAARLRRQADPGEPLLLVALTGWGQSDDIERSREAGFDHHLTKPADPLAVVALLDPVRGRDAVAPAPGSRSATVGAAVP